MTARLRLPPVAAPLAALPELAEPPTAAWGTAPAPPPWRGLAIAVLAHVLLFVLVFGFLRPHRLAPPPDQPVIALVMQKPAPPAPKAVKKPPAQALPMPPPVPPSPAKMVAAKPPVPRQAVQKPASAKLVATPHPAQTAAHAAAGPTVAARPDGASSNPQPVYPALSRERGEQGWVLLSVHVEPDGTPDAATVTQSSGYPLLDNRARETVLRLWHFDPALKAGAPTASTIDLWFSFHLTN